MRNKQFSLVLAILWTACASAAQSLAPLQGPPLGADFDAASGSLLPIQGVPGSAMLGTPFATAGPYRLASISGERGLAVAIRRDNGQVVLVTFTTAAATEYLIGDASPNPDRIILSPSGSAALLWHSAELKAELAGGLPATPVLKLVELTGIQRAPDLITVSDDGSSVMAVFNDAAGTYLERWGTRGTATLPYPGPVSAITFLRKSKDALLAGGKRLAFVRDDLQRSMRVEPVNQEVTVAPGTALGLSRDNSRVLLAAARGSKVMVVDLAAGNAAVQADCKCSVEGLFALRGDLQFQLSLSSSGPATVVNAAGARPSFSVIPARPSVSD